MSKRGRNRRSLSVGTVVMLTLTALVLIGFCALLPKLNGNVDITMNASELAVAIDRSISQIASSGSLEALMVTNDRSQPAVVTTPLPASAVATAVPATAPPVLSFTLCAAGRVNLSHNMQKTLTDDTGYLFDMLVDQLGGAMQADLSVATLADNAIPGDKLSDSNIPTDVLDALKGAGVDAMSVGHPNLLDSGLDGLSDTKQSVASAGMTAFAAYGSESERQNTILFDAGGVRVALLGYQSELSGNGKKRASDEERAFAISEPDLTVVSADIERARQSGAQVILVALCWGKAGGTSPTDAQRELAQAIADAGADIILGTNPEAVQTVELLTANRGDGRYHPTLCAYSMGNLITYNRDKRAYIAGILLGARVEYDTATETVAFDDLRYTPIYNWRGKEDGKTRYRVLVSNQPSPDFVENDQQNVMDRALTMIRDTMEGSALTER